MIAVRPGSDYHQQEATTNARQSIEKSGRGYFSVRFSHPITNSPLLKK
jgi:hypothetical protein